MIEKFIGILKKEVRKRRQRKSLNRIWHESLSYCELKPLSENQVQAIQNEWGRVINGKINTRWHQLLYSLTGVFNPRYEPFEICAAVQNKFSPIEVQRIFDDKNLYRFLLNGFNIPLRVAESVNGVYYLPEERGSEDVSREDYFAALQSLSNCILKPASGSDGGRGVEPFDTAEGIVKNKGIDVETYLKAYTGRHGHNYCIERKVDECENLEQLNPSSCNTLRVHTFRNREEGQVKFISAYVRIGKKGQVVDNAHSGGMCARVYPDGTLKEAKTVYPYKIYKETDSGVKLDGYKIEHYDKIKETAIKAHSSLPMFDLMGWDVAVDKEGNVVIIEFNPNPDVRMEQCIFEDSCLLDKQEEIMKLVFKQA